MSNTSDAPNALAHSPLQLVYNSAHDPNALRIRAPSFAQQTSQRGLHCCFRVAFIGRKFAPAIRDHLRDEIVTHLEGNPVQSPSKPAADTSNWPAIASLTLGVFGLVMAEFLPISLLTAMATDLGISDGAAGQAITVTALVGAVGAPSLHC